MKPTRTRVEGLRDKVTEKIGYGLETNKLIDSLITEARTEGYLAGYRDARKERDYDPLGVDYDT